MGKIHAFDGSKVLLPPVPLQAPPPPWKQRLIQRASKQHKFQVSHTWLQDIHAIEKPTVQEIYMV